MPIGAFGPVDVAEFVAVPALEPQRYVIAGVTFDAQGNVLPFVTVRCFETLSGIEVANDVSDAMGNYQVIVNGQLGLTYFCVAYLPDTPDVAGTTLNTLLAVAE